MGPSCILPIIHTVTIGTVLNFNGGNNGHGIMIVICKQTLSVLSKIIYTICNC